MRKALPLIVFVLISGGMYFLCMNAHIDFFPCEVTERAIHSGMGEQARFETHEATCSVMAHYRPSYEGEKSVLTGAGWALVFAFCGGLGAAAGGVTYVFTRKKSA